jgi:Protein-L-isoaspartate(D-aspartate) O-methyltransferase (PCMT)
VTAAPDLIPPPLINQLKAGGRMVIPVGLPDAQKLVVAAKDLNGRVGTKEIMRVLFSLLEGFEPAYSTAILIQSSWAPCFAPSLRFPLSGASQAQNAHPARSQMCYQKPTLAFLATCADYVDERVGWTFVTPPLIPSLCNAESRDFFCSVSSWPHSSVVVPSVHTQRLTSSARLLRQFQETSRLLQRRRS